MPTTAQMLAPYPDILLDAIANMRSADYDPAGSRLQSIDRLAAELTNPLSVQSGVQDVTDAFPETEAALDLLLREGGEVAESIFAKQFGSVRQMGPARLEREAPWVNPEGVAEALYYHGFLGRGFAGVGQGAYATVYVPSDVTPWLPRSQSLDLPDGLPVLPTPPPQKSRTVTADDSFLEDAGTLLGFLRTDSLHLVAGGGTDPADTDRLVQRFQLPFDDTMPDQSVRLALLLHLAKRLGWLRLGEGNLVVLTGNSVRAFLEKTRAEERQALFEAWRDSPEWNDLCRTPGLECGSPAAPWSNDPLQTRAALLSLFGRLQPNGWYRVSEIAAAVKTVEPNFQRPTGRYDDWSIRSTTTQEVLSGFEHWEAVEGALLSFVLRGPLHWLGAVDLAEPSAGTDWLVSLSTWGARWLGMEVAQPHELPHRSLIVKEDFTVSLPLGAPLDDRFRVERFAQWQASYPQYVYQITQRSLKRAAEASIQPQQILDFLSSRTRTIPDKVTAALQRAARPTAQSNPLKTP